MRHAIVVGLDGLSWSILEELFDRGVMSNVDILRKNGSYTQHNSIIPPFTVPAWTSLTTGVNPGKHGAYAFFMPKEDYSLAMITSKDVMYPRLHDICTMQGLNNVIINLPLSYPPTVFRGIMISDWLYPRFEVFPKEARGLVKDYVPYDPLWPKRDPADYVKAMLVGLEKRLKVIKRLFLKTKWNLFFLVFSEPDFLLHKIYDDILTGRGLAEEAYKIFDLIDSFIGWVMKNSPHGSILFLVSDHGFTSYKYVIHTNKILLNAGLIKLKIAESKENLQKEKQKRKKKIYLPKFLYKLAIQNEKLRKIMSSLFHTLFGRNVVSTYRTVVDPSSSIALMHHPDHFGVYLNSKSLFRNGLIKNDDEEEIQSFLKNMLVNVKSPFINKKIFENVFMKDELFHGPHLKIIPHAILLPKKNYWITNSTHGKIVERNRRINHSLEGIFAVHGEEVIQGARIGKISIFDIAPTILHFLNLPIPHDTDGRVLLEIFKDNSQIKQRSIKKENYLERWNISRKAKMLIKKRSRMHRSIRSEGCA